MRQEVHPAYHLDVFAAIARARSRSTSTGDRFIYQPPALHRRRPFGIYMASLSNCLLIRPHRPTLTLAGCQMQCWARMIVPIYRFYHESRLYLYPNSFLIYVLNTQIYGDEMH